MIFGRWLAVAAGHAGTGVAASGVPRSAPVPNESAPVPNKGDRLPCDFTAPPCLPEPSALP